MATLINNAGVQHYANKMVLAENRKVGSKSLPTALADIDNLIDEMKTHFDTEYGSALDMKLNNNENVFSVGTGTNVDRRSEVENSFTDVELSGNSLVNLVTTKGGNLFGVSGSGVTFNRTYNTDLTRCIYTTQEETDNYITIRTGSKERIKSNTTYTLIFNIFKNNIPELQKGISIRGSSDPHYTQTVSAPYFNMYTDSNFNITSGIKVISFTTGNNANEYTGFGFGFPSVKTNVAGQQFEIGDVVLLEGDWTNKPLPQYFEGMKSVGEKEDGNHKIEILSNNSNLISETQKEWENKDNPRSEFLRTIDLSPIIDKYGLIEYTLTFDIKATKNGQCRVYAQNGSGSKYSIGYNDINVTTDYIRHKIKFTPTLSNPEIAMTSLAFYSTYGSGVFTTIKNIKLQIGGTSSDFVPHEFNKKEISLNEPLRGLPNGIRDTIEKINGEWKIVRRCVEVTLNGSETSWNRNTDFNGTEVLFFYINTKHSTSLPEGATKSNGNIVYIQCDSFPCYALKDRVNNKNNNIEAIIYSDTSNPLIQFHINKSKLSSEDVAGFKQWLSQNPTKVIYELATPIIEDVSPITLQCWKNGTISIDEILPVETTHTVALNKPAQIKRNIEELTVLRKRVQALEDFYDQIALEQAHQLSLINHSIELDYDI